METARPLAHDMANVQKHKRARAVIFRADIRLTLTLWGLILLSAACNPAPTPLAVKAEAPPFSFTPTAPFEEGLAPPTVPPTPRQTIPPPATLEASSPLTATPVRLPCWDQGGKITLQTLETPLTPNPWPFRVYTPPCYEQETERHYPVIILIHGSSFKEDQWDRFGVDETANTLIGTFEIPPFILLMPYDWYWTYEPFKDPFGEALVTYLIPWMDKNYRTLPEREYRAIGGLSRGASWAVHLGLKHWELFGAVGGHSLPVFPTDPVFLEEWLRAIPRTSVPRFFLDIGEEDNLLEKALWFENLLNANNVPHEWHLNPGTHDEAYWTAHLEQYLRWYTETWSHLQ